MIEIMESVVSNVAFFRAGVWYCSPLTATWIAIFYKVLPG